MKRILTICFGLISLSFALTSCEKTYKCECVDSFNKTAEYEVYATNKVDANRNCDEKNINGHCELK